MPQVTVTYYGVEGTGRTVTEAKQDAGRKIEHSLSGSYTPRIIGNPAEVAVLIYREALTGWVYRLIGPVIQPDLTSDSCTPIYGYNATPTREACERDARRHLAQIQWGSIGRASANTITDPSDRAEHERWMDWQFGYRAAKERGLSDEECREAADCARYGRSPVCA
jgi:hypothetical protein